ncbi:hypothetical protein GY45DRAFT_1327432 [Cubamyces sp. BRFM 1775]|nr:hypothetical protein GY45DRAFT_1327432 [Cubamyces sp. BRFM 1775]
MGDGACYDTTRISDFSAHTSFNMLFYAKPRLFVAFFNLSAPTALFHARISSLFSGQSLLSLLLSRSSLLWRCLPFGLLILSLVTRLLSPPVTLSIPPLLTRLKTLVPWSTLYISFFRFFTFYHIAHPPSLPKISHPPPICTPAAASLVLALNVLCENTLYT